MSEFTSLRVEVREGVCVITIDRPEVRNALSATVVQELRTALDEVRVDDDVRVVIFTGSGDKSFAAGADIQQLRDKTFHAALDAQMQRLYDDIENFEKPTIAAVNGYALGGGCELAVACDIRVAQANARFGLPELNLGIIPSAGGTQRLARLVGKGRALDLILTGRLVDATEAERIGLVTYLAEQGAVLQVASEVAGEIVKKGPLAVKLARLAVKAGLETDQQTGLLLERIMQALLFTTEDKREGTTAFLEKRKPNFSGN